MTFRHELSLEDKMVLIKDKERGLSQRQLSDRFQMSFGAASNILEGKSEYAHDYEIKLK